MSLLYLSIIIPAYNEEKRIAPTLQKIHAYLSAQNREYEVIVVDDGSYDATVLEAEKSALNFAGKLRILRNGVNKGKGYSVRSGILHSHGEYVLFSDADMSTPIEEYEKLFQELKPGYDIAIGSRVMKGSSILKHQPWHRAIMGKVFNLMVKIFLLRDFNDTQCGFKLFKGDVARALVSRMIIDGFCFDVEMLYLAKRMGYGIKEVGVVWENSLQSKVTILGSSASMFCDIFRIWATCRYGK